MDKTVTEHEYEVYMPIRLPYDLVRLVREKNERESGIKTYYIRYSVVFFCLIKLFRWCLVDLRGLKLW